MCESGGAAADDHVRSFAVIAYGRLYVAHCFFLSPLPGFDAFSDLRLAGLSFP
jgi:hypothetical protein